MTDQPTTGSFQDAAAAVNPLAPPAPSVELRLEAPAPAATPVSTTAAPVKLMSRLACAITIPMSVE